MTPATSPIIALFLVFFAKYRIDAGITKAAPTTKLPNSPTKADDVPFINKLSNIFTNSITIPATGPKAKAPIITGTSLRSIL